MSGAEIMPETEEREATDFGSVSYETIAKIRRAITLYKKKRVFYTQKALVGEIVSRSIDEVLQDARRSQ
jgi:hypothetical protein